eukprot:CAMPEP_0197040298 /NCGR_PEP_ID=MMETSP1384-20130603/17030_1 /TAXON_ID=29189 /ORGANISM="Ammonia sp." /LENGTH=70 /DNA_ID=CAMNT_0042471035 /DNA_START=1 /DNA_END=210 /DNA_ORIENTATION=-
MGIRKIGHRNKIIRYAQMLRVGDLKEGEFEVKTADQDDASIPPVDEALPAATDANNNAAPNEQNEAAEQE